MAEVSGEKTFAERLVLTGARNLAWITEELPVPGPHDVLVKTRLGAISIGSELPRYCATSRSSKPPCYPTGTGYENVSVVLACGSAVRHVQPGERVVAFYGHSTEAVVPETKVLAVPEEVSDALAILVILTCDASKGVRKLAPLPQEKVLIAGCGALGLLTLFILRAYGVSQVDMVEPRVERHALAKLLGARTIFHPQELAASSDAYDVAFECSSRDASFALLQQQVHPQGRICIIADGNNEPLILTPAFHEKELQVVGTSDGWDYQKHALWYFHEVQHYQTHLEHLFELHISRHELISTFEQLAENRPRPVKVLVEY